MHFAFGLVVVAVVAIAFGVVAVEFADVVGMVVVPLPLLYHPLRH